MTLQEFIDRTKVNVSAEEYEANIEPMYMNGSYDKNQFCRVWKRLNPKRVALEANREQTRKENRRWFEKAMKSGYQYPEICFADVHIKIASRAWFDKDETRDELWRLSQQLEHHRERRVEGGIFAKCR